MHRLDAKLRMLDVDPAINAEAIKAREDALQPSYLQVAHEFADLHDRAGRMKAKGTIREVLKWKTSRAFLYRRCKRRLAEDALKAKFAAVGADAVAELKAAAGPAYDDDAKFVAWAEGTSAKIVVEAALKAARTKDVAAKIKDLVAGLPADARAAALKAATA